MILHVVRFFSGLRATGGIIFNRNRRALRHRHGQVTLFFSRCRS